MLHILRICGNWQTSLPSWEKKFCWEVGRVPWKKLLETKKIIPTYGNILKWDDSAAEEAFQNGKARYWADINGLPCNLPLPDPNAHIDEVDWNTEIDPELILDLDRDFEAKGEMVLIFSDMFAKCQGLSSNGWGDADVANNEIDHGGEWGGEAWWEIKFEEKGDGAKSGWNCENGDKVKNKCNFGNGDGAENCDRTKKGWNCKNGNVPENGWNGNFGWKQWENKVNKFGKTRPYGGCNSNYREGDGRYLSRYKTTGFNGN